MGKYQTYSREPKPIKRDIHPIWRGIGFAMAILIPIISYAGMLVFMEQNAIHQWVVYPPDLYTSWSDPLLLIKIIVTVLIMFILYVLFSTITFIINRIAGPDRYGPFDVEPTEYRGKRYKR